MSRKLDLIPEDHPEEFQFTRNWFRQRNLDTFRKYVYPEWHGKNGISYLELGCFEGMSMVWMLQRILTGKDTRAIGIDPWLMTTKLDGDVMEAVRERAFHNTRHYENCTLIRGSSAEVLRRMCGFRYGYLGIRKNSVDICMIDGNHNELAVLDDARHVYELMKPGGWMLFDDVENDIPKVAHVKQGLQTFLSEIGDGIRFLWKDRFVEAYQKV